MQKKLIIEKYGSGIKRILEPFIKNKLKLPVFEEFCNGFKVVIYSTFGSNVTDNVTDDVTDDVTDNRASRIISLIKSNPEITISDISLSLKVNRRTVLRDISKLKTKGALQYSGNPRSGKWIVKRT